MLQCTSDRLLVGSHTISPPRHAGRARRMIAADPAVCPRRHAPDSVIPRRAAGTQPGVASVALRTSSAGTPAACLRPHAAFLVHCLFLSLLPPRANGRRDPAAIAGHDEGSCGPQALAAAAMKEKWAKPRHAHGARSRSRSRLGNSFFSLEYPKNLRIIITKKKKFNHTNNVFLMSAPGGHTTMTEPS